MLTCLFIGWLCVCPARAQTSATNKPASAAPVAPPPLALNVEDFRQELARLDGVCAKLNLSDERS